MISFSWHYGLSSFLFNRIYQESCRRLCYDSKSKDECMSAEARCMSKLIGSFAATAIYCYQCNSNEETYCSEVFNRDGLTLEPTTCDGIYEAKYCVKATGMYEGTIGTRRFCSSRHHGNYCEYVQRPGDEREYRSCVYTCSSDGCNSAGDLSESKILFLISLSCSILLWCLLKW